MTSPDNRRWICQEIARDMERDVLNREGQPLTGENVAVWLAEISATIAALTKVVETLLPASDGAAEAITDPMVVDLQARGHGAS